MDEDVLEVPQHRPSRGLLGKVNCKINCGRPKNILAI